MIPLETVEVLEEANSLLISEVGKPTHLTLICNGVEVLTVGILAVALSIK